MRPTTPLDRSRQAAPQLYQLLRQKIIALEWAPGALLSRAELADCYGVSQTPVREALLKLAAEMLVDIYPQASTRVSLIDITLAKQAHFLRQSLELELVRELAQSHEPGLIESLQALVQQQDALRAAKDLSAFSQADTQFHRMLYQAAGKDALWHLVHSNSGHLDRLRRLHLPVSGKLERIIGDHRLIVQAISGNAPEQAQQRLREHLSGTLEYVEQILHSHPHWIRIDNEATMRPPADH
ncbi:DNA-binding GntR family transcriptional regulator [Advenella incenata]|jgi:DNA-binding GntR family transcriptional regulator|uniref:DNA-binding GntR family transcriptional regulator n=1 Tax=Advenella incenata TaxID=267800 RepID=A0A4Q7VBI1_9BURK|nr:GntR family transcriptional regulator [Advenella incenata]RZT92683.1 DNA-binding GntR family transcriptional regulator [Advenella incenata]